MNLVPVSYKVLYNNKNITKDISDHLLSLSYTDKVAGESDEIQIQLEDKDGLWQNDWWPEKGDTIEVQIIDGDAALPCGKFTLDEKELTGSRSGGDLFSISGLAASVTKQLRTKRSTAHENKTLKELAKSVADRHGLTIQGVIPDIRFTRITQNRETDLAFLNRMADQYGLLFSIRDTRLVFESMEGIEKKDPVISIDKTEVSSFSFTDKTEDTYADTKVSYHNPETNELIEYDDTGEDGYDTQAIEAKAETKQQAEVIAKSAQRKKTTRVQTCSISCQGNILLLSGVNVELTGFGKMSGIYHITESNHQLMRSDGYTTSFEAKKVNLIPPAKYKPKRKKSTAGAKPVIISVDDFDGKIKQIATSRIIGDSEVITIENEPG